MDVKTAQADKTHMSRAAEDSESAPEKRSPVRIRFQTIFVQERINERPEWRNYADEIIARFPEAEVVSVVSHWKIPQLFHADPVEWMRSKKDYLVLGVRTTMRHVQNGRSADFIAASSSNGCLSSCQYCYVARRKGGSNPLTVFVNIDEIIGSIHRHQQKLGPKTEPNQTDPHLWTYDIGCNADLSLDAAVCDNPGRLIRAFIGMEHAKATFATKTVNDDYWLAIDPQGKSRIRYSLMPQRIARYVDIGTSPMRERIASINRLVAGGYEVHINFSPIIIYGNGSDDSGEDGWRAHWRELWQEIDDTLTSQAKDQLACEAFFLTHSAPLHDINLQWNPKGEEFLWSPELQRSKRNKPEVLGYDYRVVRRAIEWFRTALQEHLPYCPIRYIF